MHKNLENKFGSPLRTEDDLRMCEENERAYHRMINEDISPKQLSNDELTTDVIEQHAPPSIFFLFVVYFFFLIGT